MNKQQAKKRILDYLKQNRISYKLLNEEDKPISIADADNIYLSTEIPDVIGGLIETSIYFRNEYLYCQSYYCQPLVENEEQAIRAARIVNYLNVHLYYDCNDLYEHAFVFDEDHGDVFNGCHIRYELLEEYFEESMNHILNFGVQQISEVCPAVVSYIQQGDYPFVTKVLIEHKLKGRDIGQL
ncbi:MAG: hypothetical protein SO043_10520 [Lachnospiraceae bacterium]|nr:hypothetical protein [Lachnospiraceae bacterium]MCI6468437.1 hypothetical protein [Lachnospiraceae bacterium]MDY3658463.1 hypothetical protein [Lachnospiraceae bacterium]